ncbi:MAG: M15 family metallopeptidase [Spirochaetes bacterium]|nr:M15 family metallopeptidase [Spirochaetota bacterium]
MNGPRTAVLAPILLLGLLLPRPAFAAPDSLTGSIPPKDYLSGRFVPSEHPELFARVPEARSMGGRTLWLRRDALEAFSRMATEATRDGLTLVVVSGFRSFDDQKRIWENKFRQLFTVSHPDARERAQYILQYSSMPGTSRHHWGSDLDVNSVELAYWAKPEGQRLYGWLQRNGPRFGFYQAYSAGRKTGYREEKWHYTWLPAGKPLLARYLDCMVERDIHGFAGSEFAEALRIIPDYVAGVNPAVK